MTKSLFGILVLILSFSGWAGDPPVINNGLKPKGKPMKLVLTEDLRVGSEQDEENLSFGAFEAIIDADAAGNMLISMPAESRIALLDPTGKWIRDVGTKGQGPGEFQFLQRYQVMADGTGAAFESLGMTTNISYYDKQHNFLERKTFNTGMAKMLQRAIFIPDGKHIWVEMRSMQQGSKVMPVRQGLMDMGLEGIKVELLGYDRPSMDFSRLQEPSFWTELLSDEIKPPAKGIISFVASDTEGNIYTALGNKYEVTKWDSNMKKTAVFGRRYEPLKQSEEEIKAIISPIRDVIQSRMPPAMKDMITEKVLMDAVTMAEIPYIKPPIGGLVAMADGYVAVLHDSRLLGDKAGFDIFDKKGKYVGNFELPLLAGTKLIFKNGYAYTIADDDGDGVIIRYKYKMVKGDIDG